MVLAYMDSRSVMGPAKDLFTWTPERFGRLLAYHNVSSDGGGGEPVDTLFDAFLLSGDTWYGGKNLWPYVSPDPLNATDWLGILDMHLTMGAAQLDVAAANISARLPFATADSCAQLRPAVILTIPFPDVRAENFGAINGSGRSLNFSHVDDRILACEWYIRLAHRRWAERGYTHVRLTGFYWYLEELLVGKAMSCSYLPFHVTYRTAQTPVACRTRGRHRPLDPASTFCVMELCTHVDAPQNPATDPYCGQALSSLSTPL